MAEHELAGGLRNLVDLFDAMNILAGRYTTCDDDGGAYLASREKYIAAQDRLFAAAREPVTQRRGREFI